MWVEGGLIEAIVLSKERVGDGATRIGNGQRGEMGERMGDAGVGKRMGCDARVGRAKRELG